MKKLLIGLFICLCFTSCNMFPIEERNDTLVIIGSTNTNVKEGVTTFKIRGYDFNGYYSNTIRYRAKVETFEIGDTVVIVKNK